MVLVGLAGCSTAPVADFLDLVAPGGPGGPSEVEFPVPPRPGTPIDELPPPLDRRHEHNDVPPLPPVPSGYTPRSAAPEAPAARLVPRPTG
jgi:hypothetical protein